MASFQFTSVLTAEIILPIHLADFVNRRPSGRRLHERRSADRAWKVRLLQVHRLFVLECEPHSFAFIAQNQQVSSGRADADSLETLAALLTLSEAKHLRSRPHRKCSNHVAVFQHQPDVLIDSINTQQCVWKF